MIYGEGSGTPIASESARSYAGGTRCRIAQDASENLPTSHVIRSRRQTPHYVQIRPWLGLIFGFGSKDVHGGP